MPALSPSEAAAAGKSLSSEDSLTSGSSEKVIPSPFSEASLLRKYNPWKKDHLFFSVFPPSQEPLSPAHSTVAHFLEEESVRTNELMQKLDSHIQGMSDSNGRTVSKYLVNSPPNCD